jgi:hypothetical protein
MNYKTLLLLLRHISNRLMSCTSPAHWTLVIRWLVDVLDISCLSWRDFLSWCLSRRGCKISDAGVAAPEGVLHRRLYGYRRGDGFSFWSCEWWGADSGGSWVWRCLSIDTSQIAFQRPSLGIVGDPIFWERFKGFPRAMPMGVVDLLGALLCLPSPR